MAYPDPQIAQERVRRLVRRRRRERRAKTAVFVLLAVVVLGAAGIGIDRAVLFARHLWAEHHHKKLSSSTTATTTTTTIPGPPRCTSPQLAAYLSHWEITGGTLYEIIVIDDTAAASCTLSGFVGLSVTGLNGASVSAPVHDDPTLGATAGAGTTPVSMGSGQPAWFEVSYPVQCSTVLAPEELPTGAPGQCYQGQSFGVLVPGATTAVAVSQPLSFTFGTAGFTVGPFGSGAPPNPPPTSG